MERYPKILIINSESLYKNNATGITLRSIFKEWPSDSIMELYIWNSSQINKEALKIKSFKIPAKTLSLNLFLRKLTKSSISEESSGNKFGSYNDGKNISFTHSLKEYVKYIVESNMININCILKILKENNFIPDVIYTLGGSFSVMNIACKIADYYSCHICLHYMDNWRETLFIDTCSIFKLNKKINNLANQVEKRSKCSMVISSQMKIAYENQRSIKCCVLMNSIKEFKTPLLNKDENKIKIIYAGGLHLKRYESLKKIEQAIRDINDEKIQLIIYTSDKDREAYSAIFSNEITKFKNFIPHDQVDKIYQEADILVHIESFDKNKIMFTKYSLSTKIPEYMISSKPILCFAPAELTVHKYINENKVGISTSNEVELQSAIKKLVSDKELRKFLGNNGVICAKKNHTIEHAHKIMKKVMIMNCGE